MYMQIKLSTELLLRTESHSPNTNSPRTEWLTPISPSLFSGHYFFSQFLTFSSPVLGLIVVEIMLFQSNSTRNCAKCTGCMRVGVSCRILVPVKPKINQNI